MKLLLVSIVGAALVAADAATAQSADELLKKHGCTACHAVDKKLVGPAYLEVATKYKGDAKAQAVVIERVKKGSVGIWGQIPMPPNTQVADADIKTMVSHVLGLKK